MFPYLPILDVPPLENRRWSTFAAFFLDLSDADTGVKHDFFHEISWSPWSGVATESTYGSEALRVEGFADAQTVQTDWWTNYPQTNEVKRRLFIE